jgi:hypothetical protein
MRLIATLAVLLALATPANAALYSFWRCGEVTVSIVDNGERKMRPPKPNTSTIQFERIKDTTMERRGLNFKFTAEGFALNGRRCETMPDEEWEKLHPTEK